MLKFFLVCVYGTILSTCFLTLGHSFIEFISAGWPWHKLASVFNGALYFGFFIGVFSIIVLPISLALKALPKGGDILGYFPIIVICLGVFASTLNEQISLKEWWWQLHLGFIAMIGFYVLFLNWADTVLFDRKRRGEIN